MTLSRRWLLLSLLLLVTACRGGAFGSDRPEPAPTSVMAGQPVAVTFTQLDVDPFDYRNRFVRVTGAYTPLPLPDCDEYSGPTLSWELVTDDLHLQASGYADIVTLVPEGTELTADGFWRVYRGPLGCGKEPAEATVWYLEAIRLVQPNPLPQLAALDDESAPRAGIEGETPTPDVTESTPTATQDANATPTDAGSTPTVGISTPSNTPDPSQSPTPTPTPATSPTPTPTPQTGTPSTSPTATPTSQPTATVSTGDTPTAAPPTNTPGPGATGYPGPPPPPSETETPPPY